MSKIKNFLKSLKEESYLRNTKPNYEHLDEIFNREDSNESWNYNGSSFTVARSSKLEDDKWNIRSIHEVNTDDGNRFYPGEDSAFDRNTSEQLARIDAIKRATTSPADSLTTDQVKLFQKHGLFEDE